MDAFISQESTLQLMEFYGIQHHWIYNKIGQERIIYIFCLKAFLILLYYYNISLLITGVES